MDHIVVLAGVLVAGLALFGLGLAIGGWQLRRQEAQQTRAVVRARLDAIERRHQ